MKLALIPPISLLDYTHRTNYQLMLPQLIEDDAYTLTYREHCKDPDTFVILDNGAAEGLVPDVAKLWEIACDFGVDEIVIPDDLGNLANTIERANDFIERVDTRWKRIKTMFVLQGNNLDEFIAAGEYAAANSRIHTIGIPRHAVETCKNRSARIIIANTIQRIRGYSKPIHFLGASPAWSTEGARLGNNGYVNQSYVRGMDTSAPFNYACARRRLGDDIVRRPPNYFELASDQFDSEILQHNVNLMQEW